MAKAKREIIVTTDLLTKKDVEKVQNRIKKEALEMVTSEMYDLIYDDVGKTVKRLVKEVLKENDKEFKKEIKIQFMDIVKGVKFSAELDY